MFNNIINSTGKFSDIGIVISLLTSIVCGIVIAFVHMKTTTYTKNFIVTLVLLPLLVSIAIMLVNGNLGTGVAILGVFSLVRFRSVPGTSKEITSVFFSVVIGLCIGTGYVLLSFTITVLISLILLILSISNFGNISKFKKILRINIPEDLEYSEVFDDVFLKYLKCYMIDKIKTTNMGSLYEITYNIEFKRNINEKEFIDDLRIRNGNLRIELNSYSNERDL